MMSGKSRTLAFQIDEDLLERETQRTGRKLTQREFVLSLIEEALKEAERPTAEEAGQAGAPEANVGPCEPSKPEEEALPPEKP